MKETRTPKEVVLHETKGVAIGVAILLAIACLVCFLFKALTTAMFLGLLIGSIYSVANFYMIGLSVEEALEKTGGGVQRHMIGQYFLRFFLAAMVIFIGIVVDFINPFGIMIAYFFPKMVLFYQTITERRRVD